MGLMEQLSNRRPPSGQGDTDQREHRGGGESAQDASATAMSSAGEWVRELFPGCGN